MHIVKRRGHTEEFDERKVYGSAYSACLNAHLTKTLSENIADNVVRRVQDWIKTKDNVSSDEIFKQIKDVLMELHKDASFLYETHRDLS